MSDQQTTTGTTKEHHRKPRHRHRPTWEIAYLFPRQGDWTAAAYLDLDGAYEGSPRLELSGGRLEVLPMPTELHQFILLFFFDCLKSFVATHAPGVVFVSGMRVKLKKGFRLPDVLYMKAENAHRRHAEYWEGADLVAEVVSGHPKDRKRDLVSKAREYARAGIPEYWIFDPESRSIGVLTLDGNAYKLHGEFRPGSQATSVLLPGFEVSVEASLAPPGSR